MTEVCDVHNMVLMCSAVNKVDCSALESFEAINARLTAMDVGLHLSDVKGPVMDRLNRSHFIDTLNGNIFLCQFAAWNALRE